MGCKEGIIGKKERESWEKKTRESWKKKKNNIGEKGRRIGKRKEKNNLEKRIWKKKLENGEKREILEK